MDHPDLYILRHGETVWNQQGRFQGRRDSPLTERGKTQAIWQKGLLQNVQNLPTNKFASPQGRAVETARLALGNLNCVTLDDRLQEIDFGDWVGSTREEIKSQIDYPFETGTWNFRSPNGEDFEMISGRLQSFLRDMVSPAVIVTHGVTSIILRGLCMDLNQEEMLKLPDDQGCIFFLSNGYEIILR